jgi:hypothetical protein
MTSFRTIPQSNGVDTIESLDQLQALGPLWRQLYRHSRHSS